MDDADRCRRAALIVKCMTRRATNALIGLTTERSTAHYWCVALLVPGSLVWDPERTRSTRGRGPRGSGGSLGYLTRNLCESCASWCMPVSWRPPFLVLLVTTWVSPQKKARQRSKKKKYFVSSPSTLSLQLITLCPLRLGTKLWQAFRLYLVPANLCP